MNRPLSNEEKIKKHEGAIYTAALAAGGAGVPGAFIPALDVAAVGGTWATMLLVIAGDAGRTLDRNTALKFTTAVVTAGAAYIGGSKLLTYLLHLIPGVGTVGAVSVNCLLNFLYTMRLGRFAALQMEKADFDTGDFANMIPEITAMVFAMPSMMELKDAWHDYNLHKQYK